MLLGHSLFVDFVENLVKHDIRDALGMHQVCFSQLCLSCSRSAS